MAYLLPEDSFVAWSQVVRNKGEQRCSLQDAGCRFESRTVSVFQKSLTAAKCQEPSTYKIAASAYSYTCLFRVKALASWRDIGMTARSKKSVKDPSSSQPSHIHHKLDFQSHGRSCT